MSLKPAPTEQDLLHAAIYAENAKRAHFFESVVESSNLPTEKKESIWKRESRKWKTGELSPYADYTELEENHDFVWRTDLNVNICEDLLSCFPYTYTGDTCNPSSTYHHAITVNDQILSFCQKSCFMVNFDPQNPVPTMPYLKRDKDGKCRILNAAQTLWIQLPNTRDSKNNDGITNVPMFKEISLADNFWDETAFITNKYCTWFGLNYEASGIGTCKKSIWTILLSQFTGDAIARFCTQWGISSVRKSSYISFLPDDITFPIGEVLGTYKGRQIFNQLRKSALKKVRSDPRFPKEYEERIKKGRISKFIINRSNTAKYSISTEKGKKAFLAALAEPKENDEDIEDEWFLEGIGGDWWEDLLTKIIPIGVSIGESVAIDLMIDATYKLIKKMSGKIGTVIIAQISKMASKMLAKRVMQTVCMKMITTATINVAKCIAAGIAKMAAAAATVIGIVLIVVGFAGLILDLLDIGAFNGYLNESYVQNLMRLFWESFVDVFYASMGAPQGAEETPFNILPEYTPSVFYHSVIMSRSINSQLDENVADEVGVLTAEDPTNYDRGENEDMFAVEIHEVAKYLLSLEYNYNGQKIDWELTDKPTFSKGFLSVTQTLKAERRINSAVIEAYNANIMAVYQHELTMPSLFIPLSLSVISFFLFLTVFTKVAQGKGIKEKSFLIIVILLILFSIATYYAREKWIEKTNLLQTNVDTIIKNVFVTAAKTDSDIASYLLRAMNVSKRIVG